MPPPFWHRTALIGRLRHPLECLVLGLVAMALQVVLLRAFLVVFYGNELCIGVILAFWLLWVAAGSWTGGRWSRSLSPAALLMLALAGGVAVLAALKVVRTLAGVPYGEFLSLGQLALFSAAALALPCYPLGMTFNRLALMSGRDPKRPGDPSARVYVYESFGSMIAGLAFSLLLVPRLSNFEALLLCAAAALIGLWLVRPGAAALAGAVAALAGLIVVLVLPVEHLLTRLYWHGVGTGMELVERRDSRYGELAVISWGGGKYLYANGLKVTELPDPVGAQALAATIISQHPAPRTVLLIGGGLGGLGIELARTPDCQVDYIELDAAACALARSQLDSSEAAAWQRPNLRVSFGDGRRMLRSDPRQYDVIAVNVGRPMSATSNRFYTAEFFSLVRERLEPGGIVAACGIPSSADYLGPERLLLNAALLKTLRGLFRDVLVVPGDEAHFFGCNRDSVLTGDAAIAAARFRDRGVRYDFFYPPMFRDVLSPERLDFIRRTLEEAPGTRLNLDFTPISYFSEFLLWNRLARGGTGALLKLVHFPFHRLALALIFLLALWLLFSVLMRRAAAFGTLFTAALAGFAGMAFDLLLLLALQTVFGYVYEWIGLTLGAFMLGMALASWTVNRRLGRLLVREVLALVLALTAFTAALLPVLFRQLALRPSAVLFFILVLWCGALTGASFPLICDLYRRVLDRRNPGAVYAADLIGGSFAALVVCGFLVPLYGLAATTRLALLFALSAVVFLFVARAFWPQR